MHILNKYFWNSQIESPTSYTDRSESINLYLTATGLQLTPNRPEVKVHQKRQDLSHQLTASQSDGCAVYLILSCCCFSFSYQSKTILPWSSQFNQSKQWNPQEWFGAKRKSAWQFKWKNRRVYLVGRPRHPRHPRLHRPLRHGQLLHGHEHERHWLRHWEGFAKEWCNVSFAPRPKNYVNSSAIH